MSINEKILVDVEKYTKLIQDRDLLQCLFDAGVDNWEGFEYADELFCSIHPDESEDDR